MNVAVVIPVFNGEEFLSETLDSVFAQTHMPAEVVVVDDGSTDRSVDIALQYNSVRVLKNPGDGPSAARNHGARNTSAPAIAFLDADDVWHPKHLELITPLLEDNSSCPAAVVQRDVFQPGDAPSFTITRQTDNTVVHHDPWSGFPLNTTGVPATILVRRSALHSIGGWNEDIRGFEDFELWLRLAFNGQFVKSKIKTVGYRQHHDSLSQSKYAKEGPYYFRRQVDELRLVLQERAELGMPLHNYRERLQVNAAFAYLSVALFEHASEDVTQCLLKLDHYANLIEDSMLWRLRKQWQAKVEPYGRKSASVSLSEVILDNSNAWPKEAKRAIQLIVSHIPTRLLLSKTISYPRLMPYALTRLSSRIQSKFFYRLRSTFSSAHVF